MSLLSSFYRLQSTELHFPGGDHHCKAHSTGGAHAGIRDSLLIIAPAPYRRCINISTICRTKFAKTHIFESQLLCTSLDISLPFDEMS